MKKYSRKSFEAVVDGALYRFDAYTTDTRNGFCHTVVSLDYPVTDTKVSYYNRTWERFEYETALQRSIDKFPRDLRLALTRQLIDGEAEAEHQKAEAMFGAFESLYNGLNDENKARLQNLPPMQTEGDAKAVMGLMALMTVMQ